MLHFAKDKKVDSQVHNDRSVHFCAIRQAKSCHYLQGVFMVD